MSVVLLVTTRTRRYHEMSKRAVKIRSDHNVFGRDGTHRERKTTTR